MGILSVRRGWSCPMLDTAAFSGFSDPLQAQLSPQPCWCLRVGVCEKNQSTAWQRRVMGKDLKKCPVSQGRRGKSWSSFPCSCGEELSTLQPMEEPQCSRFTEGHWRPWTAHAGAGSSWRTAALGKDPHWSAGRVQEGRSRGELLWTDYKPLFHVLCALVSMGRR